MDFSSVDALLQRAIDEGSFPSAVAAIGCKDQVFHEACLGVTKLSGGIQVDRNTLYDMASVTKVMGPTMIALEAIDRGILTLDDTLTYFFDRVPEDKKDIKIRHLMTHTAALPPSIPLYLKCKRPEDAVDEILSTPLLGPVGEVPRYSCMSYVLLANILVRVLKKPLDVLAREMVFEPLGMKDTCYCPAFSENITATEVDQETGKPWQGIVHDENARFLHGVSGNAGIFSNLHDCEKFVTMLAQGGKGMISSALMHRAIHNFTPGQECHRGLGFHLAGVEQSYCGDVFPDNAFGHTGFTGTSFVVCPETGIFVILLTNRVHPTRDNTGLFRVRRTLHNLSYAIVSKELHL